MKPMMRAAKYLGVVHLSQFVDEGGELTGKLKLTQQVVAAQCIAGAKEAQHLAGSIGTRNRMFL